MNRGIPLTHRILLRTYPPWFREEFGDQVAGHLAEQRRERRYRRAVLGPLRFWWDAGSDAVGASLSLRFGRLREQADRAWHGDRRTGRGPSLNGGNYRFESGGVGTMIDGLFRDIRHAVRSLSKNPGYATVFVITLGLGIGANTAMFSAVHGVLLRPLPYEDGDRLVYLRHAGMAAGENNVLFSVPEIEDYRQGTPSLASVAEFSSLTFTMIGHDTPRRVRAGIVTGNYFDVMGLKPAMGRMIGPEDDGGDAPPVIVLSDTYWRDVFGADPDILGKTVRINGKTGTIVGVASPAPPYPARTGVYVNMATSPHHLDASMAHDRTHRMTEVFGRLSPGATVESVRTETAVISSRLHAEYPEAYDAASRYEVTVTPLKTQLTSTARPTLLILLCTAFFVLIIACANLANLTLTRVLRRDHELAIRVSLGGSRGDLRRALMVESLVLATTGAALGLLIASVGLDLLVNFAARFTSRASEIALDGTVFGFALLVAVVASVFFTLLPPLPDGNSAGGALTRSGSRTVGSSAKRAQRGLVVAQISTSFVLLIGAGLLLRTMIHLNNIDPGFDTAQVLSMDIPAERGVLSGDEITEQFKAVLANVSRVPGVQTAAATSSIPLAGATGSPSFLTDVDVDGHEPVPGAPAPKADLRVVSPGYFEAMGIEVLRGRAFTSTDVEDAQKVVVINEATARTFFGDRDPIGGRIAWTNPLLARFVGVSPDFRTVVGVVPDTKDNGLDADVAETIYNPFPQLGLVSSLVLRINGDPNAVMPAVREAILSVNPNQPIENVATIEALGSESVAPRRLNTMLLGTFALLALVIASVGIGGVLAFSVGSRTREFGVRSALGAARRQIWSGVVAEGAKLALIGVVLGSVVAVILTRFIAGLLVGVPALDPITFLGVGLLLGAVAVVAAWIPAWRAAVVSPMEAMNAD